MGQSHDSIKTGKAFSVFYCKAAMGEISPELPVIRKLVKTPASMQLYVIEVDKMGGLSQKIKILPQQEAGTAYAMWVEHPGATNKEASGELAAILNQLFLSHLYTEGDAVR